MAKRTDDKTLRVCMRLMAAGAAVGVSYSFYRLSFLWCGFTGVDYPLSEAAFHRGGSLIQLFTFALVIVGSSVRAVDLTLRAIRHRRALIELRPLWQELVSVLPPDTIRRRLQTTPSASEERRRFRDLYGRLDERVVDISDACFELLPWVGDDLSRNALEEARAAGLDESDIGAAQEALCLRVARHRAVEGEPYALQPAETSLTLGNDLVANAQWLARVAHYYASPELDAAAAKLTAPQEVTA